MKSKSIIRLSTIVFAIALSSAHAADITLGSGTYTDTQTYDNGTISGRVILDSGANYTFNGNLTLPLAWNRLTLNSGASLNVTGDLSVNFSGVSLNGGTFTAGGIRLNDSPNWAGELYNDGKQSIEQGDSIINGATVVASQSNANFISFIDSPDYPGAPANNLWLGNDGAIIDSSGYNIGITMAMGNFSGQTGSLTKTGAGTLTLSTNNSYTGGTTVNGGVLEIAGSNSGNSYIRGTVTVNIGAELRYTGGDGTGFGFANKLDTININGGLVNSQGGMAHLFGATVNMTGGELRVNGGTSSPTGDRIEWLQSTVNTSASASTATISGRVNLRGDGGGQIAVFDVEGGDAPTDLLVSAAVTESFGSVGITKNGAGTMVLSGSYSYTGNTTVNDGVLQLNSASLSDTSAVTIGSVGILHLNHAGSDNIDSLVINGVTVPSGTYNASHPTYGSYFDGGGSLYVGAPGPQASGTWISSSDGDWSDSANWQSGTVANGTDQTATFNPGAPITATVDGNRYIGALAFTGANVTLAGTDTLRLDNTSFTPSTVSVASGLTATLATNIGGTVGLEKTDAGTLVLTGTKSYSGGTTVTGGTLELSGATGGNSQIGGALTVGTGATLAITNGDGTGFGWTNPATSITVDGGTINAISGSHIGFNGSANVLLSNGGSIAGTWQWNGPVNLTSSGDNTNTISGQLNLRGDAGLDHSFDVADGAATTDLLISANTADRFGPSFLWERSSLTKNGDGAMLLSGVHTHSGNTTINGGSLEFSAGSQLKFFVENAASNQVTGTGTAIFKGTFNIDTSAVTVGPGATWQLVDVAGLTESFGASFSVADFTPQPDGHTWTKPAGANKFSFDENTGVLSLLVAATPYETWGSTYSLTAGSEGGDLDNDGLTNFQEFAFGLIPNSGSSVNPITSQLDKTTGQFTYQRLNGSGLTYTIWTSSDLVTWTEDETASTSQNVTAGSPNDSVEVTLTGAPLTATKLFVRVKAQ
jgi:autotransporter-associated beta strand protein